MRLPSRSTGTGSVPGVTPAGPGADMGGAAWSPARGSVRPEVEIFAPGEHDRGALLEEVSGHHQVGGCDGEVVAFEYALGEFGAICYDANQSGLCLFVFYKLKCDGLIV